MTEKPHYKEFETFMIGKGYVFTGFDRPFDIYKTPNSNIGICLTCGILLIDGTKIRVFGYSNMINKLNQYFNEKEKEKTTVQT